MIRSLSIPALALAVVLCVNIAYSQEVGEILRQPDASFGLVIIRFDEGVMYNGKEVPGRITRSDAKTFGAGVNWNFPLVTIADDIAFGVTPGFYGIMGPMAGDPSDNQNTRDKDEISMGLMAVNMPLFAMARFGGDATRGGKMNVGLNAGAGYMATWLTGSSSIFAMPAFMAEVAFGLNKNAKFVKLRYTAYIGRYNFSAATTATQSSVDLVFGFR